MANTLKLKVGISLFSITILTLIPLIRSNFNAPVTIKRWAALTWDDFQGIVKPFTGYAAAISSQVYLEYDSLTASYIAFAGQNNMRSWTRQSTTSSDYTLNHEQYHFNITELHARIMNAFIWDNPGKDEGYYRSQLASVRSNLSSMQKRYDNETDHSLNQDKQRRWEYKIDSLLLDHSIDSGWVVDYYSGAKAYFPSKPDFANGNNKDEYAYRIHSLTKYDMTLSLVSFQYQSFDTSNLEQDLHDFYLGDSLEIKSIRFDTTNHNFYSFVYLYDSIQQRTAYHQWVFENQYLYKLSANFSNLTTDTTGYHEIANSFINSFEIVNTDNYWIEKFQNSTSQIAHNDLSYNISEDDPEYSYCATYGFNKQNGFYRAPIYRDDGGVLLAYDIIEHDDSLLFENILIINEDLYAYEPDSVDHLYFIPADKIPEKPYQIDFGYLLSKDSTKKCYEFHYQTVE